jgi:hypothetical protein
MDTHKNAPLTPQGREAMVRNVIDGGLSKAAASLYGEHAIIATNVPQLYPMAISDGRFWRKAAVDQIPNSSRLYGPAHRRRG